MGKGVLLNSLFLYKQTAGCNDYLLSYFIKTLYVKSYH